MKTIQITLVVAGALFLLGCSEQRPKGIQAENFLADLNKASRPHPKGNPNELYAMLSQEFIDNFESEIKLARSIDSTVLRKLPTMKMLRILSLENSFRNNLFEEETKSLILNWLESSRKEFPLNKGSRYYYSESLKTENKMLDEGNIFPQVLLVVENEQLKVNLFNTETYQEKRILQILKKKPLEELIKESAWLYFQIDRPINWN